MTAEAELRPPELTPGAMAVRKERTLPGGWLIEFESAPAGWLKKDGTARMTDWRAYHLTTPGDCPGCHGTGRALSEKRPGKTIKCQACQGTGKPKRQRVESVTTICDAILPKDGLPPWSERAGITGALRAIRAGVLSVDMTDEEAVQAVRSHKLGSDALRDEAADRGLNVHAILERFMLTGKAPNPADHPEPHRPFIRGLIKWLLWADPEPVAVEQLVADPERGYAGRLDLICRRDKRLTLVDLKTQERGAIYESAHVQCRLYAEAEARYGEHRVQDAWVVVVDGYGGFREMELLADSKLAARALDYYLAVKPICSACESQNRIVKEALAVAA